MSTAGRSSAATGLATRLGRSTVVTSCCPERSPSSSSPRRAARRDLDVAVTGTNVVVAIGQVRRPLRTKAGLDQESDHQYTARARHQPARPCALDDSRSEVRRQWAQCVLAVAAQASAAEINLRIPAARVDQRQTHQAAVMPVTDAANADGRGDVPRQAPRQAFAHVEGSRNPRGDEPRRRGTTGTPTEWRQLSAPSRSTGFRRSGLDCVTPHRAARRLPR